MTSKTVCYVKTDLSHQLLLMSSKMCTRFHQWTELLSEISPRHRRFPILQRIGLESLLETVSGTCIRSTSFVLVCLCRDWERLLNWRQIEDICSLLMHVVHLCSRFLSHTINCLLYDVSRFFTTRRWEFGTIPSHENLENVRSRLTPSYSFQFSLSSCTMSRVTLVCSPTARSRRYFETSLYNSDVRTVAELLHLFIDCGLDRTDVAFIPFVTLYEPLWSLSN